ncbi:MAG: hypothetical protein HGA77_07075 [Chlorobiaceae bacterium]|nr:hypothetical protein [Chlorobiaceae bacterium]
MKHKAITAALFCSAIALAAGLKITGDETRESTGFEVRETGTPTAPLGANTSIGYILSTVSADFALPGRPISV